MFQFTTTHVINSNYDASTNTPLWALNNETNAVTVKGVNTFVPECVMKIYKAEYTPGEYAEVKIDLSSITANEGDTFRLIMYIRLTQSDNLSYYANDTQFKGKPYSVEFPWKGTAEKTAKNLKHIIEKYGVFTLDKPLVKVTVDDGAIDIKATTYTQRFVEMRLEKFATPTTPYGNEYVACPEATVTVVSEGKEEFGGYDFIRNNIKLPTVENTRAFAVKAHEMPVAGAKYNQYTIHYCVERGPLGLNAVGDTVKSITTHVFFVNQNLLTENGADSMESEEFAAKSDGTSVMVNAADFEAALKALAGDNWQEVPEKADDDDSEIGG